MLALDWGTAKAEATSGKRVLPIGLKLEIVFKVLDTSPSRTLWIFTPWKQRVDPLKRFLFNQCRRKTGRFRT